MSKRFIAFQVLIVCLLAGLVLWYSASASRQAQIPSISLASADPLKQSAADPDGLLNPAVLADLGKHYIINFKPLRDQLVELQKKQKNKTYIYFAYLNNSSWIGLGEKDLFTAASTVKVPLAMSIYKLEEAGKLKLSDVYTLSQLDLDENFGALYQVGADKSFTVGELVAVMLQYSDNTAMQALIHVLESIGIDDPLAEVYGAMGWEYSQFGTKPTYIKINLKTLSNMFLSLYNASYIDVENSKDILSHLSKTPFNNQIVAGVPSDVMVSHKIGINDPEKTYSDCGIVYAKNRPYIMCLGSEGVSQKEANVFFAEASKLVYDYVINH